MITRIIFTLALLGLLAVGPWITTMIIDLGRPITLILLTPLGFAFGASGVASIMERNPDDPPQQRP